MESNQCSSYVNDNNNKYFHYDHDQFQQHDNPINNIESFITGSNIQHFKYKLKNRPRYSNILVIGYTNKRNIYTDNWEESMFKARFPYHLICTNSNFEGHHQPMQEFYKFMLEQSNNDDTIYIFIDTHDALAIPSQHGCEEIISKWEPFGKDIVVSAEFFEANGNELHRYWKYNTKPKTNRYLNAGMYGGSRAAIINMFEWMLNDYEMYKKKGDRWCDQISITKYANENPNLVALDTQYKIFANSVFEWNRNNVTKFKWCNKRLNYIDCQYGKTTITQPNFIHIPSRFNDSLRRYNDYGSLILGRHYKSSWNEIVRPTPIWIIFILLLVLLVSIYILCSYDKMIPLQSKYIDLLLWIISASVLLVILTLIIVCQAIDPTH